MRLPQRVHDQTCRMTIGRGCECLVWRARWPERLLRRAPTPCTKVAERPPTVGSLSGSDRRDHRVNLIFRDHAIETSRCEKCPRLIEETL
jgi:hypothetical protein